MRANLVLRYWAGIFELLIYLHRDKTMTISPASDAHPFARDICVPGLIFALCLASASESFAQSISYVTVSKSIQYVQTSATNIQVDPKPQGANYGGPYGFGVDVEGQNISGIAAPKFSGPVSGVGSWYNNGNLAYNAAEGYWGAGPNGNDWGSPTLGDLNSKFGSGTYTVSVNGASIPLQLTGDAYPNAPLLTLTGGAWSNGKYVIDPSKPLTITTNEFTAYGSHINDVMGVGTDQFNKIQGSDIGPATKFLTVTIPANTFVNGQDYGAGAMFSAVVDLKTNPALSGSYISARYGVNTEIIISAVTPVAAPPALTVAKSGTGTGTVTSGPAGINCGSTCSATFASGTAVTLAATADAGSTFAGWSGACTGTGICTVTMDAAKSVTATFNTAPFAVLAAVNVTPTSATITSRITFNPPDLGKTGAVFVTAWVPVGALGTLGISAALNSQLSVTSARNLGGHQVTQETTLAQVDASSFVLVQLTSTGWQLVSNGQLVPYANGVLGDQLAAQTILNNANPANLTGAQFCLGYGSSASDMIAAGRMQVVATISNGSSAASSAAGSCIVQKGGVMTSFGTRGTVTGTTPMYGSFALANTSEIYIAMLGPTLGILGYTNNPLNLPNVRVYDASGKDVLGNASGGVPASGCPGSATVASYYANIRGSALNANDTCVSATLPAGVYTFTINPNTASSSGELLFEVSVNPLSSASPGGAMTSFGTRGTVTPTTTMYGSFALAGPSVIYIAMLGPTLGNLGYTNHPLDLPNVRVYDASGKDVLSNASGGVTVSGCPSSATVANYYATVRGSALNANDTCVSASLPAGVYTFTINPNAASSSGEMLFEVTVNP
jgi:hypothetical protein